MKKILQQKKLTRSAEWSRNTFNIRLLVRRTHQYTITQPHALRKPCRSDPHSVALSIFAGMHVLVV